MNHFSIRDMENFTGIRAHTLRVWEQRYRLLNPKRKAGNHRYYDDEDLKYLLRVTQLYRMGYKISRIVSMDQAEMEELALQQIHAEDAYLHWSNRLLEESVAFRIPEMETILAEVIREYGLSEAMLRIIFPFLRKIGLLWLTGHVIPAQEHAVSCAIVRRIMLELEKLPHSGLPDKAPTLLFTPPGEWHEIPLLFMHYQMLSQARSCIYAGVNLSYDCLVEWCQRHVVGSLYFHLLTRLSRTDLSHYLQQLRRTFPDQDIYFSSTPELCPESLPPRTYFLATEAELLSFAAGN